MSNEFYNYIAKNILNFFQKNKAVIRPGERYCLKLDTEEMVEGVDRALREETKSNNIKGLYNYQNVYETFTIRLHSKVEIVVASKIGGMTDDFLATLRNAEHTSEKFPILMITHSIIDTITSGTGDLSAKGMPFHALSIISRVEEDIKKARFSEAEKILLEMELDRKQQDRFSDKSSLYEYSNLLIILERGSIKKDDYPSFSLLPDPDGSGMGMKRIRQRLEDNHKVFERIDFEFKHGNVFDQLSNEFDKAFIDHLQKCKKRGSSWYENYTYNMIKSSQEKLRKKLDNPLQIRDEDFEIYSGSPLEHSFILDETAFLRSDGETTAKRRHKNLLIYNPACKPKVDIKLQTNISVKLNCIECEGASISVFSKEIIITIATRGCVFALARIKDINNGITYEIKVCVIDLEPKYLENIQTCFLLSVNKYIRNSKIRVFGITKELVINPGNEGTICNIKNDGVYSCNFNQTLRVTLNEEEMDSDTGHTDFVLKCGTILIPIRIEDEFVKKVELTGIGAFKRKHRDQRSLEYRGEKIIAGTAEFFPKEPYKTSLIIENVFVENRWLAVEKTLDGYIEYPLDLSEKIRDSYVVLVEAYRKLRTLPSLGFYKGELYFAAKRYVEIVEDEISSIPVGQTLSLENSNILLLGCVIKRYDEYTIAMSPLHPLNVMYQLRLLEESDIGLVRDNLVEKLSALYLLPYIKDNKKNLYHVIEQKHSPEWHFYALFSNKRYHGTRNFVQKLVCDKIVQYKEHFSFLFEDLDNNLLYINLINTGDCREVFQGILRFYEQKLGNIVPEDLLSFEINIYTDRGSSNLFLLLADQNKLKAYIKECYSNKAPEDISELALVMTGKIRCFFRSPQEQVYQYAHLAFYEMTSLEDSGSSRMDSITTGISLGGLVSGEPSILNVEWYKTGFGTQYARKNQLVRMATYYNALSRVAFSGSSYEKEFSIFTEIKNDQQGQLNKIYKSSNWVVFIDPKVDLSFFQKTSSSDDGLMIIHYSDQYTSASGYDDITVTQKSDQYRDIIYEQLQKKNVDAEKSKINEIINLFNAVNGGWMLRLITAKKLTGAADSYFSREKMSILSAIKLCMAYYSHPDVVWVPVSLEEMLRVSGGAGLSQKNGLLSAKNLGFESRATSDDILLVGIEGPKNDIKIYLHPVEVKIGQNSQDILKKANEQVLNTYAGFWKALWPDEERERDKLERKLSRNFFIQLLLVCCEKMNLYEIYPDENWDSVLTDYRESLLNEEYVISNAVDSYIGKGTIISFGTEDVNKFGEMDNEVCLLKMPEKLGTTYMVMSVKEIEDELDRDQESLPERLKMLYTRCDMGNVLRSASSSMARAAVQEDIQNSFDYNTSVKIEKVDKEGFDKGVGFLEEAAATAEIMQVQNNKQVTECQTGMQILFGTDVISGKDLLWRPNDTNQVFHTNTGIIGTMGTGKTQFTKSLIAQLYREQYYNYANEPLGILIFDYKGDYNESKEDFIRATEARVLKPYLLPFNPFALVKSKVFKPLLPIHTANAFKDTLSKVYNLGPKQQNILFQCILDAYAMNGISAKDQATWDNMSPTFDKVYELYANDEEIKKNDSLAAALEKLYQFQVFEGDPNKTISLFELLKGVVVIDLSGYDADIQSLIVAITLDLFYSQMQAMGSSRMDHQYRQLTKLILVDEADNFMSEGFSALKKILKEGREFGVGTILSTQFLKHFGTGDDDYSKYILTWVVHNVADLKTADVEFVFKTEPKSLESQTLYNDIKGLEKHYSIVKIGNTRPVYIKDRAFWELYKELAKD